MKFGIIKERKNPPDRRVVFSPGKLQEFKEKFRETTIKVESSDIRVFSDETYKSAGLEVTENGQWKRCPFLFLGGCRFCG